MNMSRVKVVADAIPLMDKYLREEYLNTSDSLANNKLWENTYIKKQIDKRKSGGTFTIGDHIRAMVYSMLSSGIVWARIEKYIDNDTSQITAIDDIFFQYQPDLLLQCSPEKLRDDIKNLHCASQYTLKQMRALLDVNIRRLMEIEKECGSVDTFYEKFVKDDSTLKTLVLHLSSPKSEIKLNQMGEALVAEYLKNVGYDIAKPDRHIRRILGSEILDCSDKKIVPIYEAFDIVAEIAKILRKSVAEVDYILWSYCANGYGEICTSQKPKCSRCVVATACKKNLDYQ